MQVVIPAFNEETRLPRTLEALKLRSSELAKVAGRIEVIVVDNASTDATAVVAAERDCAQLPIRVISCSTPGKGAAVRAGIAASDADIVGFMDADGATDLDAIAEGWRLLALGADLAIGSRAVEGALTNERHRWIRERGAAAFRFLSRKIVPGVADSQCGFKLMRGDLARELATDLVSTGFSFDVELLARARAHDAVIVEFPVVWTDVPGSKFDPARHGVGAFLDLAAIAWRTRRSALRSAQVATLSAPQPTPAISVGGAGLEP